MSDKPRMELSAIQVIGGALAAASAAVAASLLGVYGTVAGAAVVSVLASVGGAVYTHSFRRGKQALEKAKEHRTGRLRQVDVHGAVEQQKIDQSVAQHGGEEAAEGDTKAGGEDGDTAATPGTRTDGADGGERPGWRKRLAGINPKAVAVTAACVLVLSLSGILVAEAMIGKPISSALGRDDAKDGNSLTRLTGGGGVPAGGERTTSPSPTAKVTRTATPGQEQTDAPTTTAPTDEPTSAPTTSRPVLPPTSSKPTTSKPTTSKPVSTSPVLPTDGDRQQVPKE